jgi:hypothetical protein
MGKVNEHMLIVTICQEFKWTYNEYMDQPLWFLTLIREKMMRDNKEQEMAQKRINYG